jgi:hypothetical protein
MKLIDTTFGYGESEPRKIATSRSWSSKYHRFLKVNLLSEMKLHWMVTRHMGDLLIHIQLGPLQIISGVNHQYSQAKST